MQNFKNKQEVRKRLKFAGLLWHQYSDIASQFIVDLSELADVV